MIDKTCASTISINDRCVTHTSIIPILVTFNPDNTTLLRSLNALLAQATTVIVVDNGSDCRIDDILQNLSTPLSHNVRFIAFEQNYGLGKAYNAGIALAKELNADFVLLMDHDSIPESNMLAELHSAFKNLEEQGKRIAAVGPRYRDCETNRLSEFVAVGPWGLTRLCCDQSLPYVRADFIISSGSLISLRSLDQIGDMDEDLFIDHIDTDWCFRAKAKGFDVYGACNAIMRHSLGERRILVWCGRWRSIPVHRPFRYYYMFRNSVLLWRRSYMPTAWKRADKIRMLCFFLFFLTVSPNRRANLSMMLNGLKDGFREKSGRL